MTYLKYKTPSFWFTSVAPMIPESKAEEPTPSLLCCSDASANSEKHRFVGSIKLD
jgi:hypothetical protein